VHTVFSNEQLRVAMGPGGLTLDAYKGRSFTVKQQGEARPHVPRRASSSEHENWHNGSGSKLVQPAPNAVHPDPDDADYQRMPARELQLFSGTLEKKIVAGAKVSWDPRHAVLTGKISLL